MTICVAVLLVPLAAATIFAQAEQPSPGEVYQGFYTGEIIPQPWHYNKLEGEVLLARRDAAKTDACILLADKPTSAAELAADELQARIAYLLGPEAPRLPIVRSPEEARASATVICLDREKPTGLPLPAPPPSPDMHCVQTREDGWVLCWGQSPAATYFAVQSLVQLTFERDGAAYLRKAEITDWPAFSVRSFKIGGQDWDLIREMGRWCGHYKYNCLNVCYTTVGRDQWEDPSPEYRQLIADLCAYRVPRGLDVMPFVNPYYLWKEHIVISDDAQIDQLADTCAIGLEHGARKVMLCLDDFASESIPYTIRSEADRERFKTLGEANARLVNGLHERLKARFPDYQLFFVPPYYWIPRGSYEEQGKADLALIGQSIPEEVHIVWTGPVVRSARITKDHVDTYSALIDRRPFLWDNTLYMHHNPTSYLFDAFITEYPDRFWEINDTGIHYNAGGGEIYKVGLMTTADHLWNPKGYRAEWSLRRALHQVTGSQEAAEACLVFRDAYYRIYDTYKPLLDSILKLTQEPDFPYRPFDTEDIARIELDLLAVREAYRMIGQTCRNERLTAEIGERAERYEQYSEMIAWIKEHQPGLTGEMENVAFNGGAEEIDDAGRPIGWGTYQGAGTAVLGTSTDDPAEGQRCAYVEAPEWYDLNGRDWINVALVLGNSNGYTGPEAYEAQPLTKYRVRFRLRGDAATVRFAPVGWTTEEADRGHREPLFSSFDGLEATGEWQEYETSFTTSLDTRRFALKFGIEGYRDEGAKLGRVYVDHVRILFGK